MNAGRTSETESAFEVLRQFVSRKRPEERCELCSQELYSEHTHLLELATRKLLCSCDACALLFSNQDHRRYKRVPRQIRLLNDFQMSDAEWEALLIPINMAFFFSNSLHPAITALYPSPAGATESLLTLETWSEIVHANPVLNEMESDVEALLVNRIGQMHGPSLSGHTSRSAEYYLLPIDECYKLTGLIRRHWRGLSGGAEVWQEIATFFDRLRSKATVVSRKSYA